ncbi:MAG: hypothetical protein WD827_03430 [Solirubrobacterales bacterium]
MPVKREARAAHLKAGQLKAEAEERQEDAVAQISRIEADHAKAVDDHDQQVQDGIALGLAALVVAALALGWGRFRASAGVAWLTDLPLGQAVGLCVGGGLMLLIVGGAMSGAGGFVGVLGMLILLLGLVLPVALLLARHSAQIQRGRSRPLLKRERMPEWAARTLSAVMLVLCLVSLGGAIFASSPAPEEVSAALRDEAEGKQTEEETHELVSAETRATELQEKASKLSADQSAARTALGGVRRRLHQAERELVRAQGDVRSYTRRLAALTAREAREAEKRAEIEAEELEEEELEPEPSGCDPNYTGCVPNTGYDVDCAEVSGPVEVIGVDVYGLDADNDGIGCES